DPPYGSGAGSVALDRLHRLGWIGPATWVSLETAHEEEPKLKTLEGESSRKVGKARITLLRAKPAPAAPLPE
ncbi:MAG TPA: 16S rRNA (guanine(966)-N(2))-methyltransferase RsmD, partial [Novosphingobium sp.]|nr:16S rRNA (guanine(966)-N(2))-methyltransferase RsmD [Novosphingobium sp.]